VGAFQRRPWPQPARRGAHQLARRIASQLPNLQSTPPSPCSPPHLTAACPPHPHPTPAVEPIIILNAAFCERHLTACPPSPELSRECGRAHQLEEELGAAYAGLHLPDPCVDREEQCQWWVGQGASSASDPEVGQAPRFCPVGQAPRFALWGRRHDLPVTGQPPRCPMSSSRPAVPRLSSPSPPGVLVPRAPHHTRFPCAALQGSVERPASTCTHTAGRPARWVGAGGASARACRTWHCCIWRAASLELAGTHLSHASGSY
jgi:hypothetical protein